MLLTTPAPAGHLAACLESGQLSTVSTMGTEPPATLGSTGEGWNHPVLFRPLKTWGLAWTFLPKSQLTSCFLETIHTYTEDVIIIYETLRLSMVNKNFIWVIVLTIDSKYTIMMAPIAVFHQ